MFYIMSAGSLVNDKAVTLEQAHATWQGDKGTIIVAKRATKSWGDSFSKIFIHGAAGDYGVNPGDKVKYTQDTGLGYKCQGFDLIVENVIHIDENDDVNAANDIGLNEKRRLWVFK